MTPSTNRKEKEPMSLVLHYAWLMATNAIAARKAVRAGRIASARYYARMAAYYYEQLQ